MKYQEHDVTIIGGGLAGLTAGIYCSRAGLHTVLLEKIMPGGQIINADVIENFTGFPDGISGAELGPLAQQQAIQHGVSIKLAEVSNIYPEEQSWIVETDGENYRSSVVIACSGSTLKTLGVPGEKELYGSGVSYCATCDGGFFQNQIVGIVGSGDSALDEALVLTQYASKVILLCKADKLTGAKSLQDRVLSNDKIEVMWNATVKSIKGNNAVEEIEVSIGNPTNSSSVKLSGIFIYIGLVPNSSYLKHLLPLDERGHVPTDIWMHTDRSGLFAVGDLRQHSASQLITAAGDGATAAVAAKRYIERLS